GFVYFLAGLIYHLSEHSLERSALKAHRGRFDRKCLRAKWFHLKPIAFKLVGDLGKNNHLRGLQFHEQRHQKPLSLNVFNFSVPQNLFKKNSLMSHMLIDYPQAILPGGKDKGFPKLSQWAQRTQMIEVGGGLFVLNFKGFADGSGKLRSRAPVCRGTVLLAGHTVLVKQ